MGMENFKLEEAKEDIERPRQHYVFSDSRVLGTPKIFECDANDDKEAKDLLFRFLKEHNIDTTDSDIRMSVISNE